MKKHPVAAVLLTATLIVGVGASVAYYNTKSFGFDEDTVIFSRDDDGITVFDSKIYYKDIEEFYDSTKYYVPQEVCSTAPCSRNSLNELVIYLEEKGYIPMPVGASD